MSLAEHRYHHVYGGLRIASETPIARLPAVDATRRPDIVFAVAEAIQPGACPVIYQWVGRFEMTLARQGDDWVFGSRPMGVEIWVSADGRRLVCAAPAASAEQVSEFLIRRVLPRVAQLHARLTLHAALVEGPDGCVMLVGRSGAGKSTLSTALGRMPGWRQLSDDISILAPDGRSVWASAPGAYLTPTSADALSLARDGGADPSHSGKAWFNVGETPEGPRPVAGLVLLGRRDGEVAPRLTPIAGLAALPRLAGQFLHFDPSDRAAAARLFASFGRAVATMRCYRLAYPSDFAALPAVGAELRKVGAPATAA
jgi:hypothetical protein